MCHWTNFLGACQIYWPNNIKWAPFKQNTNSAETLHISLSTNFVSFTKLFGCHATKFCKHLKHLAIIEVTKFQICLIFVVAIFQSWVPCPWVWKNHSRKKVLWVENCSYALVLQKKCTHCARRTNHHQRRAPFLGVSLSFDRVYPTQEGKSQKARAASWRWNEILFD